ncbi:MAG TPA: glucose-1-phosphate cytidylyltransferase [Abditibacteriaceae bacterium]|jgi:glucose-1-phosphate cytidylyltransferase
MKVVLLAGGYGTRISEETHLRPKPMIEIGGAPILWHIMKLYASHGLTEFVVCLGYKGYYIKEYFANYFLHRSDVTFDLARNEIEVHERFAEPWRVTLIDTGRDTMTGGRLKRVADYLGDTFCCTYGDGVGDVDITSLIEFHKAQKCLATITAAQPPGRFGRLDIDETRVRSIQEKPVGDGNWINGGFFVLEKRALDFIEGDETLWEKEPLETLAAQNQLAVWKHSGFWQPMDTLRDKVLLEELWESGKAPWKNWDD